MSELASLTPQLIKDLIAQVKEENEVFCEFSDGGVFHIEKHLPFLMVYRKKKDDEGVAKLLQSQISYLMMGSENLELYQTLIVRLSDHLSTKFKSYFLLEIYTGNPDDPTFYIRGPAKKLPTTLHVFQTELKKMNPVYTGKNVEVAIEDTPQRQRKGDPVLLGIEEMKKCGALWVGLEIPPVFRNEKGKLYPVFFRNFRNSLLKVFQKTIYEYIRVQTSLGVKSYSSLGKKKLQQKVFEIDKQLSAIERSYQFLWLVAPSNIQDIKMTFFKSNYEKVLNYHYRLLPIDPDILKRKLYQLPLEEVEDPVMSFIFHQKREELDQQITMLGERGTRNFFYSSIRLYKGIEKNVRTQGINLLKELPEETDGSASTLLKAKEFKYLAAREFDAFTKQAPHFNSKIHIRKDVNVMMVSQGELYIPADYKMNQKEAEALIQHEVGTHVLTYFNGRQQPLEQLSVGLAGYDSLQEGLAVLAEYFADGLTANRLRTLAGRVVAGSALLEGGDFIEVFRLLCSEYGFSKERAFNITSRIFQGGGFLKDIVYLKGLIELKNYLKNGEDYLALLSGKFSLSHVPLIRELTEREILTPPKLKPSYLTTDNFAKKLQLIKEDLPLSKMISS